MEKHIPVDDTYINVIKFGSGKKNLTVIAGVSLTGLEGLGEVLASSLSTFSEDFTVYVFDRRKVLPQGFSMNQMAEDIYYALKELGVKSTSVYGASQGGMIGMLLALSHPEFVESLALCSTLSRTEELTDTVCSKWLHAAKAHDVVSLNTLFLDYVYSDAFKDSIKDSIPALLEQGTAEDCDRFVTMVEAMKGFDIYDELGKIKCPVLVLCDEQDKVISSERGKEIAAKCNGKLVVYNQFSHAVYDENPDVKEQVKKICI